MQSTFDISSVAALRERLNRHPLYGALRTLDDVRGFMAHHVYSVWDFMSLVKTLQQAVAPAVAPWAPLGSPALRRFINEIVLEEESDESLPDTNGNKTYVSHFELYCQAMHEIGADAGAPLAFVDAVRREGIHAALARSIAPAPARRFMEKTFGFIATGKPHMIAAAFALGREQIIPGMFRSLLWEMKIGETQAPSFHYYLKRHIHLDEDHHGPLSLRMLDELCAGDPRKLREAKQAAREAIAARIEFWDDVLSALEYKRSAGIPRLTGMR
jgi:hypothetical protein